VPLQQLNRFNSLHQALLGHLELGFGPRQLSKDHGLATLNHLWPEVSLYILGLFLRWLGSSLPYHLGWGHKRSLVAPECRHVTLAPADFLGSLLLKHCWKFFTQVNWAFFFLHVKFQSFAITDRLTWQPFTLLVILKCIVNRCIKITQRLFRTFLVFFWFFTRVRVWLLLTWTNLRYLLLANLVFLHDNRILNWLSTGWPI